MAMTDVTGEMTSYEVVIVGGGVSGTAILFALACYTNIERIALVEQYAGVAQVNSSPKNNSQTLHFGDTETNYSLQHALPVREAGVMLANYVQARGERRLHRLTRRMVLAVGVDEVARLRRRSRQFWSSVVVAGRCVGSGCPVAALAVAHALQSFPMEQANLGAVPEAALAAAAFLDALALSQAGIRRTV